MRRNFWLLPDPHIGHTKLHILKREAGFENLIFNNIEEKPKSDVLIVLGDFIFKKHGYLEKWLEIVADRQVWLIRGNHDRETVGWYYDHGFCVVADELKINMFGINILLSHKPLKRKDYDINICGHLHGLNGSSKGIKLAANTISVHIEREGHHLLDLRKVAQSFMNKVRGKDE